MANEAPKPHFMYVLECSDDTLYTGYTTDVAARVAMHNLGKGAKYTKTRRPVLLVASAQFPSKHQAMSAEFRFKQLSRERKEELLAQALVRPFEDVLTEAFPQLAGETGNPAES
jgi:putative endonuclease